MRGVTSTRTRPRPLIVISTVLDVMVPESPLSEGSRQKASRPTQRFRGEFAIIPFSRAKKAAALNGKALAVGLLLYQKTAVSRTREIVLSHSLLAKLGIEPEAGRRALRALEDARLVQVTRAPGRAPRVVLTGA